MDIQEMHQYFRVYGEQIGLELMRNILPEEIDVYLNTAINEKVREALVSSGNAQFQDRISVRNNPITHISYISTLYKEIPFIFIKGFESADKNVIKVKLDSYDILCYIYFEICYYLDDNIENADITQYYHFRYIDRAYLNNTLMDFCNRATYDYPIIAFMNHDSSNNEDIFTYNIDDDFKKPAIIRAHYIKNPAKVSFSDSVSCDLPNYTHTDIVQLACQKFYASLQYTNNNVNKQ